MNTTDLLSFAFDKPISTADIRTKPEDFIVDEISPIECDGAGEHLFLHIQKIETNTHFVARQLAKFFKVTDRAVSYAGIKDRHGITSQWFSVHLPGKKTPDLAAFAINNVKILSAQRHSKKLKTGTLKGNRFSITLRNISNVEQVQRRWQKVIAEGVPNYFGEQRFGINGNNLTQAKLLFSGEKKVRDKTKRGLYLSAARAFLFNQVVSARFAANNANSLLVGDVAMLEGSRSVFKVENVDDTLMQRFTEKDIDITAPLWGRGELMSFAAVKSLEMSVADENPLLCAGLEKFGLNQERRKLHLHISNGNIEFNDNNCTIEFVLPAGCFATAVLRELVDYTDCQKQGE